MPPLDPNTFLIAEYNYIAQTAFQATEDRSRVSNFYFVTAGAAIGAILSSRIESDALPSIYAAFGGLFIILTIIGALTILQLARLRTAWEDSARAMNVIKDFYILHNQDVHLDAAFIWRNKTIPRGRNFKTVAFLLTFSILAIGWGTTAAAFVYLALIPSALARTLPTFEQGVVIAGIAIVLGGIVAVLEYLVYERWLFQAEEAQGKRERDHYAKYEKFLAPYSGPRSDAPYPGPLGDAP